MSSKIWKNSTFGHPCVPWQVWMSEYMTYDGKDWFLDNYQHLANYPIKIRFFWNNQKFLFSKNTVKGIINHSDYIRTRVYRAIVLGKKQIQFRFTSREFHHWCWISFYAGTFSPEFVDEIKIMDLVQLIAAAACFGISEDCMIKLLDFKILKSNHTLHECMYYAFKCLQWEKLVTHFFYSAFSLPKVFIPEQKLKNHYVFHKFLRDLKRSLQRWHKNEKHYDSKTGFLKNRKAIADSPLGSYLNFWDYKHLRQQSWHQLGGHSIHHSNISRCPTEYCCSAFLPNFNFIWTFFNIMKYLPEEYKVFYRRCGYNL